MTQTLKHQLTTHNSSHLYGRAKSQPNPANVNPQYTISLFTRLDCFITTVNSPESLVDIESNQTGEKFRPVEPQRSKQEV